MVRGRKPRQKEPKPLSLHGIPFEEAVADVLKVKPPPDKPKRGGKGKRKRRCKALGTKGPRHADRVNQSI